MTKSRNRMRSRIFIVLFVYVRFEPLFKDRIKWEGIRLFSNYIDRNYAFLMNRMVL